MAQKHRAFRKHRAWRKILAAMLFILFASATAACQIMIQKPEPETLSADDLVNTAAAQTVAALSTELASGRSETRSGSKESPKIPTITLTAVRKTAVVVVTRTVTPTPSEDCNRASFVRDVTIPDGSTILPNSTFTKTWELKNTGSCAWNSNYAVVFAGRGTAMSGPASTAVIRDGEIKPGETAQVSVTLRAPGEPGDYEGYWILRDSQNQVFGTGENSATPFFVKIRVDKEYSFADHICSAQWRSGAGDLPCPGSDGDSKGYVLPLKDPTLEDNVQREGLGWLAAPQAVNEGYIAGAFPAVIVPAHSDFRAILSCAPEAEGCYVRMRVTYRVDNGDEQLLGEWSEGYEGKITQVVKDLDMAAGKPTIFTFYVYVSGQPEKGKAIWFFPRIIEN